MSTTSLEMSQASTVTKGFPEVVPLDITDERLMEEIQGRNVEALGQLHDRYAGMLKALVMKVLHNDAESDDMVQEIFVEIWERAGSYNPEKGKALGWIVTLSRRHALDRLRKREASSSTAEGRIAEQPNRVPLDVRAHVDADVAHAGMREQLQDVIATLPSAQKQAIELAFYKGMSQREIAAYTGVPLGTVKTRLELGLKRVAKALKRFEDL